MRALRTATAVVGKRTERGAKIKLAPRAEDALFARAGNVEIGLPYLMHSLQTNDNAENVGANAEKLSEEESDREKARESEENEMREKTYDRIAREYYWKGMYYDIKDFVRACEQC